MPVNKEVVAYIGLGSNLDNPERHLSQACVDLANIPATQLQQVSSLYRSVPLGPPQPDYINAVAALITRLSPQDLLANLQAIEQRHGRVREQHWGPRTLDLDLLLYGDQVITTPDLTVPHTGLLERNFVLIPLFEIAPKLQLPDNQSLETLAVACPREGLERLVIEE
ncbi:MAG: 2-amino-4-hydroxy-6-hydroxymethyldihydropteridine diphosphokinase [Gammaproteobacteria bacterium]|nr:2-amino-4-hydroxy-6-hydroxymethyldihydropteridine diphosphokinase [Gammaproteobacteria bacterium]